MAELTSSPPRPWTTRIAEEPLASVRHALDASEDMLGFDAVCGLLAAVQTAPERITPSAWLDLVKGDHTFEGLEELQGFSDGIMALYNEIGDSLGKRGADCCPAPSNSDAVQAFCEAYLSVASLDPTWEADADAFSNLLPLFVLSGMTSIERLEELLPEAAEDPEGWLRQAAEELPQTVSGLYSHWTLRRRRGDRGREPLPRRERPKVGRNDPCPCGSGKKFKRCCAN